MQKIKISDLPEWDAADYLETAESQAAYLSMVMEDGDASEIRDALNSIARARGMTGLAATSETNRLGLYSALEKDGNPAFSTVLKVVRALGLTLSARTRP